MSSPLVNNILEYMEDKEARYAIAIEGDWGSGKTRFCEGELKEALGRMGYAMLRVSLLGINDVDGLYTRLAMALVHLGNSETDDRGRKLVKDLGSLIIQGGISFGKKILGDQGVTIEATPQMLASVLGEKQLLVLDDFERSGFFDGRASHEGEQKPHSQAAELFGAVNSLVDGQNCKVMFVTSSFSGISADVREKLIWKCLRFDPKPEDLARDIIIPKLAQVTESLDFDAGECVCHASAIADCTNARAMIKATKLLSMAFESDAARESGVDKDNREAALRDFVRFSLLAAMGRAPRRPAERQESTSFDFEHGRRIALFNQYSQLDVIDSFFDAKKSVAKEDVDTCLSQYVASRYAGTPETMRLRRVLESVRYANSMEDEEVAELAAELSRCILYTEFDLSYLCEAVQTSWTLRSWGFEEAVASDKLLDRAKELVDANPENAYRGIHSKYVLWSDEWQNRYDGLMADLDAYAVGAYERFKREKATRSIDSSNPKAGKSIADTITKGWGRGENLFLDFDPKLIASCFANGDATSQIALYEMSMGLEDRGVFYRDEQARQWALSLLDEMRSIDPKSRMGCVRKRWMVETLEKLASTMSRMN